MVRGESNITKKIMKTVIAILLILLILSVSGVVARVVYIKLAEKQVSVMVPDNLIGEQSDISSEPQNSTAYTTDPTSSAADTSASGGLDESSRVSDRPVATTLSLYSGKRTDNTRFDVKNMLPGDSVTKYFCVKVNHSAEVDLIFTTEITSQTKNLSHAMDVRVTNLNNNSVLYDGVFAGLSEDEFVQALQKNADGETAVYYQIDVSLPTATGNEYQAARLTADLQWYVRDDAQLLPPRTGDNRLPMLFVIIGVVALFVLIIVYTRKRKKETVENVA